jgi:small basic protein (TIGR04137 family)
MSIHKSLVPASKLGKHRNVFTRAERIKILHREGRWAHGDPCFGLPKLKNIKMKARTKSKKAEEKTVPEAGAEKPEEKG